MRTGLIAALIASLAAGFANPDTAAPDEQQPGKTIPIEGHYVRPGQPHADFDITETAPGRIYVYGLALSANPAEAPDNGELEFQTAVNNGEAVYQENSRSEPGIYRLTLRFRATGLTAKEEVTNPRGTCFDCGMNVYFAGNYRRSGPATGETCSLGRGNCVHDPGR